MPPGDLDGYLVRSFGGGCPNAAGVRPVAGTVGAPRLGNAGFVATLRSARASSTCAAFIDFGLNPLLLPGGYTLWLAGAPIALGPPTGATGVADLPLPVPNDASLIGASRLAQWLVSDPSGQMLGSLTATGVTEIVIGR